ncbi:MAG TPA: type I methionyl aminopeptidase [Candidatus Caccomonas pullistercoris]|nr:type I methionyl aminopeptidase [Candidatus Caccomonas pullistercoris]
MTSRQKRNWTIKHGEPLTELDKKILSYQNKGILVPRRDMIKTPEQIEGIRRSGVVNTGVLDLVEQEIRAGMTTADIDKLVYDYTVSHGAIPAPLNYEGFPKSVCTSVNEVVCHGIPSEFEVLEEGDIVNVDVSTILDGYYSDASRMFIIGQTTPEKEKLVRVTKECLEIGAQAARPWGFLGEVGKAIEHHAKRNGFSVVRDLCGHGVGLEFHEDPEVDHYNTHERGMLLVPGMVFTIEPMINMGTWRVFVDEEDGWTVVTEDEKPSAQWEHTFLVTEDGLEVLTH